MDFVLAYCSVQDKTPVLLAAKVFLKVHSKKQWLVSLYVPFKMVSFWSQIKLELCPDWSRGLLTSISDTGSPPLGPFLLLSFNERLHVGLWGTDTGLPSYLCNQICEIPFPGVHLNHAYSCNNLFHYLQSFVGHCS